MDSVNQIILNLIRENARMSYTDIGRRVGLSRVAVKKRMDAMESAGIIKGYRAVIDERLRDRSMFDELYAKYGQKLRFPISLGEGAAQSPIEDLALSARSANGLHREGIRSVGDLVSRIGRRSDLLKIRNLGEKSADEIMKALLEYQYSLLTEDEKLKYIRTIEEMNTQV